LESVKKLMSIASYVNWIFDCFPRADKFRRKKFEISSYGVLLRRRPSDLTFNYALNGHYGSYISQIIEELKENVVVLDIGANLGLYSLLADRNPFVHAVHAFEPDPISFRYLTDNILRNGCVKIYTHNLAIGLKNAKGHLAQAFGHSGGATLVKNPVSFRQLQRTVPIVNEDILDFLIPHYDLVFFVKIDVEGFEFEVLQTLSKTRIFDNIKFFIIEFDDTRGTTEAVTNFLQENNFVEKGRSSTSGHFDGFFVKELGI